MLIDTGAEVTLANQRVVKAELPNIHTSNRKLTGVTGETLEVLGALDLDIKLYDESARHEVIIVKDIPYDVIIGKDFLLKENYTLKFQPLDSSDPKSQNSEQTASVRMNKTLTIPAASRQYIKLQPDRRLDLCTEARVHPIIQSKNGVWVEDALTKIGSDGRVLVCVINENNHSVILDRRTRLATLTCHDEQKINNIQAQDWMQAQMASNPPRKDTKILTPNRLESILEKIDMDHLNSKQRAIVHRLVKNTPNSFALDGEILPTTHLIEHGINTGDAEPIRLRPYRTPECYREPLKETLKQMQAEGIIKPSFSNWAAPAILIPKKDTGRFRLVADYRMLNKVIKRDNYPLPRIDDLLDHLKAAKVFSVLDMKSGFSQVALKKSDAHKSAFVCTEGIFEHLRLSQGLATAPSCFQRLLETIFADLIAEGVLVYIDDIIIYTETEEQHEALLKKVLERLAFAQLSLRPDKCKFFRDRVNYLGHLVTAEGIYPLYDNIKKVKDYPIPKNVDNVRSFIGLTSYYRRFIKGYAEIAKPLTELTQKENVWHWDAEQQSAFELLKRKLIEPPILAYPRFDTPFTLTTDSSSFSIGAVLSQVQDNVERVVAFGSRTLSKAEQNYSTTERECLSIVHFINEYRHYLLGRHFTVISDHQPLSILNSVQEPRGRLGRWQIQLSEYDFDLKYKAGKSIPHADAMSRIPVDIVNNINDMEYIHDTNNDDGELLDGQLAVPKIKIAQQKDKWCSSVINYLRRQELPKNDDKLAKRVVIESGRYVIRGDGILTHIPDPKTMIEPEMGTTPVIVLPKPLRKAALGLLHDHKCAGHLGFKKTLYKVQSRFFWQHMFSDIKNYTQSCESCARVKTPPLCRTAPLTSYGRSNTPLDCIQIDIVGPIRPAARDGSTVILVVTDLFTRFAEAYPLEDQKADLIAKTLVNEFFSRYGSPRIIRSDHGSNFTSNIVKEICKLYEINQVVGSTYHPMSQGSVERQNRVLVETLKHYVEKDVFTWSDYIPHAVFAYNSSIHASTLYTPYSLFFGRLPRLPLDAVIHKPEPNYKGIEGYREDVAQKLYSAHQNARINAETAAIAQKKYYDKRAKKREFYLFDRVYITNEKKNAKRKSKNDCRKFRMNWIGPCEIIKYKGDVSYVVRHLGSGKKELVHVNRLKLAYPRNNYLFEETEVSETKKGENHRNLRSTTRKDKRKMEEVKWRDMDLGLSPGGRQDEDSDDSDDEYIADHNGNINLSNDDSDGEYIADHNDNIDHSNTEDDTDDFEDDDKGMEVAEQSSDNVKHKSDLSIDLSGDKDTNHTINNDDMGTQSHKTEVPVEILEGASAPALEAPEGELVSKNNETKMSQTIKAKKGRPVKVTTRPTDAIPISRRLELQSKFNRAWLKKLELERNTKQLHNVDLFGLLGSAQPDQLEYDYVLNLKHMAEKRYGPAQVSGAPPRRSGRNILGLLAEHDSNKTNKITWNERVTFARGQVENGCYIRALS